MAEYDNTNTITVNVNDKGDNPARPDHRADININGVRYFGSLWVRDGKNGKFLSGPLEKADDQYQPGAKDQAPAESAETPSEDQGGDKGYF